MCNIYIYSFLLYNNVYTYFQLRKVTIMSNLFDLNMEKVLRMIYHQCLDIVFIIV